MVGTLVPDYARVQAVVGWAKLVLQTNVVAEALAHVSIKSNTCSRGREFGSRFHACAIGRGMAITITTIWFASQPAIL